MAVRSISTGDVSHCLNAGGMGRIDYESKTMVVEPYTLAIRGREGGATLEARQDGVSNAILTPTGGRSGVGVGAVAFSIMPMNSGKDYKARETDIAQPIMAAGGRIGNQGGDAVVQAVCATGEVFHTLRADGFDASEDGTGRGGGAVVQAFDWQSGGDSRGLDPKDTAQLQRCQTPAVVGPHLQVRRLTPTECERLQGFPDGWTAIPYRGKPAADGPRYKSLGNSMAIPVVSWIGRQIEIAESGLT